MIRNAFAVFAVFAAAVIIVAAALWFVTQLFGIGPGARSGLGGSGFGGYPDPDVSTSRFVSKNLGVSLRLPPTWQVEETDGVVEFITPNGRIVLHRVRGEFADVQRQLLEDRPGLPGQASEPKQNAEQTKPALQPDQVFFFRRQGWVYYLAADSPRLFDQLLFVLSSLEFVERE